jgi:hypothetical protein
MVEVRASRTPDVPVSEEPMRNPNRTKKTSMSADAYAGFLKLLLTPVTQVPRRSPELDAYLRYLNEREPLSDATREAIGLSSKHAA